jgi:uncharacterized membrane protein YdjX (TVP38/TMEM64 family)
MTDNLEAARTLLERRKRGMTAVFALFVVSPLPSAQLFVAAGLLELPLGILTVAFFLGRMVSYSIYVAIATLAERQFGNIVGKAFGSPWSIALQLGLLVLVCLLPLIDWKNFVDRSSS